MNQVKRWVQENPMACITIAIVLIGLVVAIGVTR
jgi:hypothetical protein